MSELEERLTRSHQIDAGSEDLTNSGSMRRVWISIGIILAALVTRVGLLGAPAEFDEFYHYIPALGWPETGELRILDGSYTRASAYTLAVARFLDVTGQNSLFAARLVSLLPGLLLPLVLFWWVRAHVGETAAVIATAFAILWPQGILESQLLRFYSLHVLLFFAGAISVYAAVIEQGPLRWVHAVAAIGFLGAAMALQITTFVACGGIVVFLAGHVLLRLHPSRRWVWGIGSLVLIVVALATIWPTGALDQAWALYRFSPDHAIATRDYAAYYHNSLRRAYETFWPLFPVAALFALRLNARLTWYCVAIFSTVLVLQSFGAMKADRYISGAMPFFFTIWGMAAVQIMRVCRPYLSSAALLGCTGFLMASNGFVISSAKMALGGGYDARFRQDFSGVSDLLASLDDDIFVATTHELHMVVETGGYNIDVRQQAGWEAEFDPNAIFGLDPRTGRYAVRGEAGLEMLLGCVQSGVMITVNNVWQGERIGEPFRRAAAAQDVSFDVIAAGMLVAVHWQTVLLKTPQCEGVPDLYY